MNPKTKLNQAMKNRNRIAFAYIELAKDRKFSTISDQNKTKLIKSVINFGEDIASWVSSEFDSNDPRKIAHKMGVKIFGEDKGIYGKLTKRSEYRPRKQEIIIFRDALQQMMHRIGPKELRERLLRYLVAHELFHHLERSKFGLVYKKFRVVCWQIGPFKKHCTIKRTSEVAAQAFTQKLLDIQFSPRVFDYLTYVLYTS